MRSAIHKGILSASIVALTLVTAGQAQQGSNGAPGNAGQATQPAGAGNAASSSQVATAPEENPPAATQLGVPDNAAKTASAATSGSQTASQASADDNPYDPILEPPPLPKGKPTLIGGRATSVDHVRNRLTIQPFGGGPKIRIFVDERSHIYRNGAETTVLGINKGDRIYVDTMLDGSRILAKNVRVLTQSGLAEVHGQVIGVNPEKGTISVRDQLSSRPVSFSVSGATRYSSSKGAASAGDVQSGAMIDVQFSPRKDDKVVAQEITILAKPGDNYIFSGAVTNIDMRSSAFFIENRSDQQTYEVHFGQDAVTDMRALKVGSEVTARTTFDGKQYKASNIRIENLNQEEGEQSKAQ
jgi:hypothetical protein